jgi:hypothetical protein
MGLQDVPDVVEVIWVRIPVGKPDFLEKKESARAIQPVILRGRRMMTGLIDRVTLCILNPVLRNSDYIYHSNILKDHWKHECDGLLMC